MSFLESWNEAAVSTLGLFWTAIWAFCLGYIVSSMIQVYVTQERMQQLMGKDGCKAMTLGTFFGFISSSCSFAALSGARALFAKGAGLAPALAFLLASTNLVIELGIIISIFLSWQFVVAEYVGGIMLIVLMWFYVRVTAPCIPLEEARKNAQENGDGGSCGHHHHHHGDSGGGGDQKHGQNNNNNNAEATEGGSDEEQGDHEHEHNHGQNQQHDQLDQQEAKEQHEPTMYEKLLDVDNLRQVAMQYFMEWAMVWKDVTVGFTVAGIIAAFVPREFFEWLFIGGSDPNFGQLLEHCIVGPVAAFFTFIGSMGNIPLAAVLYSNGVSFAGIIAFIFSDLVVIPVVRVNAKYYGWRMALYILSMFFVIIIVSALILHYIFDAIGILPSTDSVTKVAEKDYFHLDYTFALNVIFLGLSAGLFGWHFKMNGVAFSMGSSVVEIALFWLAMISYGWLIGGLFAGLAN